MFAKKAKSTALVLLNNAVRRLVPGEAQDKDVYKRQRVICTSLGLRA